ncbi:membrane protein [Streptomyces malachitofuscus]|nr:membrane protein [Streptomyces malachitofuscus]
MSMTPPPGWYRDPHAPHLERWWDGTAWTEHRRPPETPTVPLTPSTGATGGTAGTGRAKTVALATAGAVLVGAIVTGAVFLRGDDGEPRPRTGPTATASATELPPPSPSTSEPETADPDVVEDQLNGITFPLLDGWVRPKHVSQDDVVMTTDGTYDCPGEGSVCRHGLVISRTVTETDETSPEALAKKDISDAAEEAFGEDALGQQPYGGVKSHDVVKSGPVAVAGRAGYFVRWRVTTGEGPGGHVQSMVFPSSVGTESPVVVRYVIDAGQDAPPLTDMDRITEGIQSVTDADSGGGVGSSIGPTP